MQRFLAQTRCKSGALSFPKPRKWNDNIPRTKGRYNSTTTRTSSIPSAESTEGSAKAKTTKPSILVTHGEPIFRLILVSQATFGVLTVFWWHMHYFELQDEKNEEIAALKKQLKEELQATIARPAPRK